MLEGKVAIVTGGTRGIGYQTVQKFLENKAQVVLFGSKKESVLKAIESLKTKNSNYEVLGFYPDLTNFEEVTNVFKEVKRKIWAYWYFSK